MQARGVPTGFGFWNETAGFDVNQSLISFSALSTYGRAFWVGLINTLLVSAIGVALATPLGFALGVARLSRNWLTSRLALIYVEITRNTPLLLQLLFWYNAVLKTLPGPRQSLNLVGLAFLNNRGLYLPRLTFSEGSLWVGAALGAALLGALYLSLRARARRRDGDLRASATLSALALILGLPALAYVVSGRPVGIELAELSGFNLRGGLEIRPEFAALAFGLVIYTAGFIAEIVRAGVLAVALGQSEAAAALGLDRRLALRLVVIPQALRLIGPPLTSQYLNIVKNSSLAVFIGYPDLVLIFAGTVLNQTHAALQVMAITMGVYLAISLAVSFALNLFNARSALQER
ncbi:MAG: ABC transporter permease subunit [Bradyrhizobium sp.]|nr:MAG: ABC transporter permease subunit [Bradyrhizobium sp.]